MRGDSLKCQKCGTVGAWRSSGFDRASWFVKSGWNFTADGIVCALCGAPKPKRYVVIHPQEKRKAQAMYDLG